VVGFGLKSQHALSGPLAGLPRLHRARSCVRVMPRSDCNCRWELWRPFWCWRHPSLRVCFHAKTQVRCRTLRDLLMQVGRSNIDPWICIHPRDKLVGPAAAGCRLSGVFSLVFTPSTGGLASSRLPNVRTKNTHAAETCRRSCLRLTSRCSSKGSRAKIQDFFNNIQFSTSINDCFPVITGLPFSRISQVESIQIQYKLVFSKAQLNILCPLHSSIQTARWHNGAVIK
jgi:hypothetical protein